MMINHSEEYTKSLNLTEQTELGFFIKSAGFRIKDFDELHVNTEAKARFINAHSANRFDRIPDSLYDGDCGIYLGSDGKYYTAEFDYSVSPFVPLIWTELTRE